MGERQPKFRLFRHLQRDHRDPSSYGPLRPRDLHGPDIEGPAAKYTPVIVDFIPFVGTATNAIRIGPILYHVGRGFKQGDELRMDRRAKHLKTDSKSTELTKKREFLEKYLLDRFDRVNRLAKETYHGQKLTRAVRRTVISALGIGAAIAAN
ncbi:MAG TPA: hypothetical protein VLF20_02715, partial [Patescibacteria group bacterium]|nr:hypothetical protein [Patescibacteria group bacterium]